jgi:hypothetical protein
MAFDAHTVAARMHSTRSCVKEPAKCQVVGEPEEEDSSDRLGLHVQPGAVKPRPAPFCSRSNDSKVHGYGAGAMFRRREA